jgi:acetylornithine/N-succinyldiaminopimelate aminotransferase
MEPVLPTYARQPLSFERGEGVWLFTKDDDKYLDFAGGIAVTVAGYSHPHLVEALKTQADKLWHTSNLYRIEGQERLARRLVDATFADTVFFTNSGAEALEGAIKMARRYHYGAGAPERWRLITFEGAFHGRTLATIAAAGQEKLLKGFGPPVEGFDHVPFGDLDAVRAAIGPETAGILFEPIQGEGGIRALSPEQLRELREIADEAGILLVLDEVQCGMGRTGKLFAYEWAGIEPDILAAAKGIGGGFPLGAILASEKAAGAMTAGSHGSTYGGNPLAMAVGNAVLDLVLEEGFLERVRQMANQMRQGLEGLKDAHEGLIEEVRGVGLLLGLKLRRSEPAALIERLREEHMLAVGAGDNVVRLLPPLVVSEDEISEALARLDKACAALEDAETEK